MEAIALVEHLKELTANPQNRATIVKDKGCLAGLVLFLDNSDNHVIITALQALKNLVQHKPNQTIMKNELGMLESLRAIIHRNGDVKTKQVATEVYDALTQEQSQKPSTASTRVLRSAAKKSKTYIIQIKGLKNQIQKRVCEEQLLAVKGVISFTFDMVRSRCIVRAKPDTLPESICSAINKTKALSAQQVIKNERGEEVFISFSGTSHNPLNKSQNKSSVPKQETNTVLPDYLPEDDELTTASKSVLAKIDKDNKENQGWFGSVGSFISKTLYW